MVNDIFDPNDVRDSKQYEKLSPAEAKFEKEKQRGFQFEEEEEDIVMGEPVYYNNQQGGYQYNL